MGDSSCRQKKGETIQAFQDFHITMSLITIQISIFGRQSSFSQFTTHFNSKDRNYPLSFQTAPKIHDIPQRVRADERLRNINVPTVFDGFFELTTNDLHLTSLLIQGIILQSQVTGQIQGHPGPIADHTIRSYKHIEVMNLEKYLVLKLTKAYSNLMEVCSASIGKVQIRQPTENLFMFCSNQLFVSSP